MFFFLCLILSEQIRNDDISKSSYAEIIAVKKSNALILFSASLSITANLSASYTDYRCRNVFGLLSVFQSKDNKIGYIFVTHLTDSIPIFKAGSSSSTYIVGIPGY